MSEITLDPDLSKDARFWDKIAPKYAKSKIGDMVGYEKSLERIVSLVSPQSNVLELGCGTGTTALRLAPNVDHYKATDISPAMIVIAQEKLAETPQPNLEFAAETAESVTPPEGGYDRIIGLNYVHLVADLTGTLAHISRLLNTGGLFISKTPCLGEINPLLRLAIPVMRLFGKAPASIIAFDESKLASAIIAAGFEIDTIERHASKGKDVRPFIVARKV